MSEEFLSFEFLEFDRETTSTERQRRVQRRLRIRDQTDPFVELAEAEFTKRFRLTKQLVRDLCDEVRPSFSMPKKTTDLSVEMKVLTTLSFLATGSYQRPIGDMSAHSLAQQTVSAVIAEVVTCLNSPEMRRKYICFPKNLDERNKTRARFYQKFQIPGVLGCIDGTHVAIIRPIEFEERYYSRKHYHSLNVQLICDANMQITNVDAGFGGATHDSFIWNSHPLKAHLENLDESTWLLGDSGYPLRKYMMTPIVDAAPNTPESYYTEKHVRTRNIIERTIGLLKARFRCLLVHRVLHYTPEKAASIVNACVILHNICIINNLPVEELSDEEAVQEANAQIQVGLENVVGSNRDLQLGQSVRRGIIASLWEARQPRM